MNLYGVMLFDDLSEFPAPDTYVYLTEDAAQRRADRRTYEYDGVKYWATVYEINCGWDVSVFGPFNDNKSDWVRFIDYAGKIKRKRDKLRAENAKLREMCRRFSEYVNYDCCEGCAVKRRCNNGEVDECWQIGEIRKLARELGIEVAYE